MVERKQVSERDCLFCKLVRKEIPSWVFYDDGKYMAFLTPYPNTPGVSVVIPKKHVTDYVFDMTDEEYSEYMNVVKKVAKHIDKILKVQRTALVFEGTEVAHVHAKLYPLHGGLAGKTKVVAPRNQFSDSYLGYLTTVDGPKMDDRKLDELRDKLKF